MISVKALVLFATLGVSGEAELLYFWAPWCQPCRTMQPVVARLESAGFPIRHVDIDREPQLAQRFGIQSVPCFVMLHRGQEVDRVVGATNYDRLHRMFRTTVPAPSSAHGSSIRAQSPDPSRPVSATLVSNSSHDSLRSAEPMRRDKDANMARALAATVRLRIDDERGHSYGTGTIIDVHKDEALVLTCGHIFRDSGGKGQITVDLFHAQSRGPLTGKLIGYDLKRDVGLVSIRPALHVTPVQLAGVDDRLYSGQPVFSLGCDRGSEPRTMDGRITAIDRYMGPHNLSVSGQPVDGRSGGGLFTVKGILIGVCNAADPQDDEGLYAAAPTIHSILDHSGLGFIYRRDAARVKQEESTQIPHQPHTPRPTANPAAVSASRDRHDDFLLQALQDRAADAEIICIVRSRDNPQAASRVVVLDQLSDEFRVHLAREIGERRLAPSIAGRLARRSADERNGSSSQRREIEMSHNPVVRGQTR